MQLDSELKLLNRPRTLSSELPARLTTPAVSTPRANQRPNTGGSFSASDGHCNAAAERSITTARAPLKQHLRSAPTEQAARQLRADSALECRDLRGSIPSRPHKTASANSAATPALFPPYPVSAEDYALFCQRFLRSNALHDDRASELRTLRQRDRESNEMIQSLTGQLQATRLCENSLPAENSNLQTKCAQLESQLQAERAAIAAPPQHTILTAIEKRCTDIADKYYILKQQHAGVECDLRIANDRIRSEGQRNHNLQAECAQANCELGDQRLRLRSAETRILYLEDKVATFTSPRKRPNATPSSRSARSETESPTPTDASSGQSTHRDSAAQEGSIVSPWPPEAVNMLERGTSLSPTLARLLGD